jgi:hypothetical protein
MIIKDDILTLVVIVIINSMRVDLNPDLVQLKDLLPPVQLKLRKGAITTNIILINFSP